MSLLNFFNPFGGTIQPGARQPQYSPVPQLPDDGRSYYTGQIGADQYNQAGNVNNNADPSNGAKLGPTGFFGGRWQGPGDFGGFSQLGWRRNPDYTVASGPVDTSYTAPNAPVVAPHVQMPNQPQGGTPKPPEPNIPNAQPMMGQWGGGGWNVGSGAPASAQPMWLGSMNGGQSWAQAPGYNTRAPQAGQQTSMWHTAPNQDADSPTWVQRG